MLKEKNPLLKLNFEKDKNIISQNLNSIFDSLYELFDFILNNDPIENFWFECLNIILSYLQLLSLAFDEEFFTIWKPENLLMEIYNIINYFNIFYLLSDNLTIFFIFFGLFLIMNYGLAILIIIMAYRIKNKKLSILWPISILKIGLPFISYMFFSQSFLLLSTIFDCTGDYLYIFPTLKCISGLWFSILAPLTLIGMILQSVIALITNILYFKSIFNNIGSDLLKKTNTFNDTIFIITKIAMNLLFIIQKGEGNQQWLVLFFSILFTGTNAYYYLTYKNRLNKTLNLLNSIFSLILVSAFIILCIAKMFAQLDFTGSIYFFFLSLIIIPIYILFYKNKETVFISIDYKEINNSNDYIYYISDFYSIIKNQKNTRNDYSVLETLISNIEENCIISDCPLKKYNDNIKNGIECPYLLIQFCEKIFEYGISKFPNDIYLKNNYALFLITEANNKNKALMILNRIEKNQLSFAKNYYIFGTLKLFEKWNFSLIDKNNSILEYKDIIQDFKSLMKKIVLLYYEFLTLLLNSKFENNDSFNKVHKIGREIMKLRQKLDENYNTLINIQTDNIEIIKLYSEFIEGILNDEDKLEECLFASKISYSSIIEINEKDFSNFHLEFLKDKGNNSFLIISASKGELGKIIDLSINIPKIFGYTQNELIGNHINILIPKIFHKVHDLAVIQHNESDKLKFFNEQNKKILYFPNFIKKEVYGISKLKFLIELNLNIYFTKTEEFSLVYIIEIENYKPIIFDLIKSINYNTKYCILTDENFLIQTVTPNCVEYLKIKYSDINSNFSIINYIKQFKDDYLKAINNTVIKRYSRANKNELSIVDKNNEKKSHKSSIPHNIRKKIKNDLINKKYSKKCKISWKIGDDNILNNTRISGVYKKSISYISSEIIDDSPKNINRNRKENNMDKNDIEINLFMEIQKIIINKELIGYYFFFSRINNNNYNNISYVDEGNDNNTTNNYLSKSKKYQCNFLLRRESFRENSSKYETNNSNLCNSLIIKPSEKKDNDKIEIKKILKKRRKSVEKKIMFLNPVEDNNNSINNSLFTSKYYEDDEGEIITDKYIPKYSSHFSIDLTNLSFFQTSRKDDKLEYLELLKNEASEKIRISKEQLDLISKESGESLEETEEYESEEDSKENSSEENKNSSYKSSQIKSLNGNEKIKNSDENNIEKKENNNLNVKFEENDIQKDNTHKKSLDNSIIMNKYSSNRKLIKKNNYNFYKVDLSNVHFMIYDFYKDMVVDGNKNEAVSKIENILASKNSGSTQLDKDERFSLISKYIYKSKKSVKGNKENNINENNLNNNNSNNNNINEENLFKMKIYEALNKHKDEPPVIKLKFFIIFSYIVLCCCGGIILFSNLSYFSKMDRALYLIKNIISVKYCSQISVYYLRELTLLNFVELEGINNGEYINFIGKDKEEYKELIREELLELFIESQNSLEEIYSSNLSLNKNSTKILSEIKLDIKVSDLQNIKIKYDILTALMQYSSAFYNLVTCSTPIEQNHPDLINHIYNNLNGYKNGLNILVDIYKYELKKHLSNIIILFYSTIFFVFAFISVIYFLLIKYLLLSVETRGNYMKIFYGLNENILKTVIDNCENILNKLKSSEEVRYNDEKTLNESIEEKANIGDNQKIHKKLTHNWNLNNGNDNKKKNQASYIGITFVTIYGLFSLICLSYFIYNCIYLYNTGKKSISLSNYCDIKNNNHLTIIEFFNVYRELIFDNQTIIQNMTTFSYIEKYKNIDVLLFEENDIYLTINSMKYNNDEEEAKTLCSYYINDFFDSSYECEEIIGLITNYDFQTLSFNFIEDIRTNTNILNYRLLYETILGNLTEYNSLEYLNNKDLINSNTFRLNLFNDNILHFPLNRMFFSIILPYIEEKRKSIYNILTVGKAGNNVIKLFIAFLDVVTLMYLCYFLPITIYINKAIYKTKNMLCIIPLNILVSQSGISKLLNISKDK